MLKPNGHRIKASDLEALVCDVISSLAPKQKYWEQCWKTDENLISEQVCYCWENLWSCWPGLGGKEQLRIIQQIIDHITINNDTIKIRLSYEGIIAVVANFKALGENAAQPINYEAGFIPNVSIGENFLEILVAAKFKPYGRTQLALDDKGKQVRVIRKSSYNQALVNAMVKSYRWNRLLEEGKTTITTLAEETKLSRTYISRIVSLMFLAPDIVIAIMTGSQPATLNLHDLLKNLPVEWESQREILLG